MEVRNDRPPRLKLVKVLVQPVFVLDHGDRAEEVPHQTIAIPADEWPAYSGERFPREVAEWQARIDAEHAGPEAPDATRNRRRPKR